MYNVFQHHCQNWPVIERNILVLNAQFYLKNIFAKGLKEHQQKIVTSWLWLLWEWGVWLNHLNLILGGNFIPWWFTLSNSNHHGWHWGAEFSKFGLVAALKMSLPSPLLSYCIKFGNVLFSFCYNFLANKVMNNIYKIMLLRSVLWECQ